MPDRLQIRVFKMDNPDDVVDYEAIKQDVVCDGGKKYSIVTEHRNWDKTGALSVALEYVERDTSAAERY